MNVRILIVDDEQPARYAMRKALANADYHIDEAEDGQAAVEAILTGAYDLVFLDLTMPVLDGRSVLREISPQRLQSTGEIVVVTADDNVPTAVECIQLGASDFISKPYEIEQLRAIARRVSKHIELRERVQHLEGALENRQAFGALVGISRPMTDLFGQIQRIAAAPLDVLVQGETGTGKELVARELHARSNRASGPFVAVNTAAIAEALAESELFGHVKGAYTGADANRQGCFEQAKGGTLFLDEIGDMPPAAQSKMLRVLQERVVQPVGSSEQITVDVRVISATHQDLQQSVDEGHFRQDLYFRIKGVCVHVPPLRQRREDIPVLANHVLQYYSNAINAEPLRFSQQALDRMLTHDWPGNVRELEHAVKAAAAMCDGEEILPNDLQLGPQDAGAEAGLEQYLGLPLTEGKTQLVQDYERTAISRALDHSQGNVSAAARSLGIHRQSLQQKMSQLGIRRG